MADLWALEAQIKGQPPQERLHARRELTTPIVDELFTRWEDELTRISGKSKLAEAIRYGLSRKSEFKRFLDDGRIDIDNNSVERAIRPQTITRKNAFLRVMVCGRIALSTLLLSISIRPSSRKRLNSDFLLKPYRIASASFDLPDMRVSSSSHRVKSSSTIGVVSSRRA